jgi:hypothetical protein
MLFDNGRLHKRDFVMFCSKAIDKKQGWGYAVPGAVGPVSSTSHPTKAIN